MALSGTSRWGRRHRRTRGAHLALGLNGTALALLAAVLAAASEPGLLTARWHLWPGPFLVLAAVGGLGFRFPRTMGLPLVLVGCACLWWGALTLGQFKLLIPGSRFPQVQPLTDKETVTIFATQVDTLTLPPFFPGEPRILYRWRPGNSVPSEWWWAGLASSGVARTVGVLGPTQTLKFGVYRLSWGETPSWTLVAPEVTVPLP